jgi:hypothetical protein
MSFSSITQLLDELAPAVGSEQPAWEDVLRRAGELGVESAQLNGRGSVAMVPGRSRGRFMRVPRRPLIVALALLVVALVPVTSLAVVKDDPWWFLRGTGLLGVGEGPAKGSKVVLVREERWGGHRWALTAYRSVAGHLCFQLTEEKAGGGASTQGGASCTAAIGSIIRTASGRRRQTISFMSGTPGLNHPIHEIVGPVVGAAAEVKITLVDGTVISTPTFPAPSSLGMPIRFYAAQLPLPDTKGGSCLRNVAAMERLRPSRLVALDGNGRVVAALTRTRGPSLRASCLPHRNRFVSPLELAGKQFTTVGQVIGPYGARATIAVSGVVGLRRARPLPNGSFKKFVQRSRCWRVGFSNGQSQGTCVPLAKRYEPELSPWIQHAGRDTFVFVYASPRIGAAIARVELQLANGRTLSKKPIDGVVVFAIPKDALSTKKSQRGWLIAYDKTGHVLVQDNAFGHVRFKRQAVYYRSCPPGSSCHG